MSVLGFQEPLVVLTAAHFHFAGCAVPVLSGLAMRALPDDSGSRAWCLMLDFVTLTLCAGPIITAIGITWSPRLESFAAPVLALGVIVSGALTTRAGLREIGAARALLCLAGLIPALTMTLAAAYALRGVLGVPFLSIPAMAAFHGAINVIGFALPAIIGWDIARAARGRSPLAPDA